MEDVTNVQARSITIVENVSTSLTTFVIDAIQLIGGIREVTIIQRLPTRLFHNHRQGEGMELNLIQGRCCFLLLLLLLLLLVFSIDARGPSLNCGKF